MVNDPSTNAAPLALFDHPLMAIERLTPNWFAATMGTGILAIALAQFPVKVQGLFQLAEALWLFNIGLFVLLSALYATRWLLFFEGARRVFDHSVMAMYFGCIPMGLATIINGFLIFGVQQWGQTAIEIAKMLWWLDAAMAFACGVAIPFMMFTRQSHALERMTAIWLLPVVAAEVAAVSGGLLAPYLADAADQLTVLVASYALWAVSVPIALSILVILVLRLVVHKLPHVTMAASSWLALGPIGTGALGLLVLGAATPNIFAANGILGLGEAVRAISLIGGLLLWGYGLWWMATAALTTLRYLHDGLPFNIGWWGFTFPIGVYAVATLRLSTLLPVPALMVFGAMLVCALSAIWIIVAVRTSLGAWRGQLFVDPTIDA